MGAHHQFGIEHSRFGRLVTQGRAGIWRSLDPLARPAHVLDQNLKKKDTVWIEPRFEADVEFTEISNDGYVRHPSFKGLSEREVKRPVNSRRKKKTARPIRSART